MNCWMILKIEPTTDLKAIKHAYAILAQTCHPEEDPEGFKLLQEAYQEAVSYARNAKREGNGQATFSFESKRQEVPSANREEQRTTTSSMPVYRSPQAQTPPKVQTSSKEQMSFGEQIPLQQNTAAVYREDTDPVLEREPIPGKEYYQDLFKNRREEIDNKIEEQGKVYKYKFEYLLKGEQSNNILAWRDILRREDFKYALYDNTFLKEMLQLLQYGTPCAEVLFEIYYYYVKNKARQDWYDLDFQIFNVIKRYLA